VMKEEDGVRVRRRREGEGRRGTRQGQSCMGRARIFRFWRMRRGTKQKVDRAITGTLRRESAAGRGKRQGKASLQQIAMLGSWLGRAGWFPFVD
jgi:hypothetical protein